MSCNANTNQYIAQACRCTYSRHASTPRVNATNNVCTLYMHLPFNREVGEGECQCAPSTSTHPRLRLRRRRRQHASLRATKGYCSLLHVVHIKSHAVSLYKGMLLVRDNPGKARLVLDWCAVVACDAQLNGVFFVGDLPRNFQDSCRLHGSPEFGAQRHLHTCLLAGVLGIGASVRRGGRGGVYRAQCTAAQRRRNQTSAARDEVVTHSAHAQEHCSTASHIVTAPRAHLDRHRRLADVKRGATVQKIPPGQVHDANLFLGHAELCFVHLGLVMWGHAGNRAERAAQQRSTKPEKQE